MFSEWFLLLSLGFGLGFMHALDADHVMAVSSLANQKPSMMRTLHFSLHWALGHGSILMICGILLLALGITIPSKLQHLAEISVGLLLIGLGVLCFWQFRREKITLTQHRHGNMTHIHWQTEHHTHNKKHDQNDPLFNKHQPVMVGMVHGLAGSAPVIALIPAVASGQILIGIFYLLFFSIGMMLSMLFFGVGFSWIQTYLQQHAQQVFMWNRYLIAGASVVVGSVWLWQTV
ncbi:urease accessory protein [Candidatus Endobugula sertula]|uniref:Urease accessory protein n=1 Tax=Candidatus Endobugula sertula TaxID=62101 RepID=A0A1D2QM22_9GAMM|nr:urease accessory protein [Candidatus Endobugula sertula]